MVALWCCFSWFVGGLLGGVIYQCWFTAVSWWSVVAFQSFCMRKHTKNTHNLYRIMHKLAFRSKIHTKTIKNPSKTEVPKALTAFLLTHKGLSRWAGTVSWRRAPRSRAREPHAAFAEVCGGLSLARMDQKHIEKEQGRACFLRMVDRNSQW